MLEHLSLPRDVRAELDDSRFDPLKHYNMTSYYSGCRGPLCMKKSRDLAREKNERRAIRAGREYGEGRRHPRDREMGDLLIHYLVALKREAEAAIKAAVEARAAREAEQAERERERTLERVLATRPLHRSDCKCDCFPEVALVAV